MRSLAFDTTGAQCAVALWVDGRIAARDATIARHGHAALLAPMIADVLARGGMRARALDRIAVTRGPGGFTGVRVGLATARGLALATCAPTYGPTTFDALLLSTPPAAEAGFDCIVAVVDSRLAPVFVQVFTPGREPLCVPRACEVSELPGLLPPEARRPLVIGDAAERGAAALTAAGLAPAAVMNRAPDVAALAEAATQVAEGALAPPVPLYIAPPAVRPAPGAR